MAKLPGMQTKAHVPTFVSVLVVVLVLFALYHLTLGRKRRR